VLNAVKSALRVHFSAHMELESAFKRLSEPMCYDWGESSKAAVLVLDGEAGWLSCPLFSHPSVYNYTSAQSAGHNLLWYRLLDGHDLEQPIMNR